MRKLKDKQGMRKKSNIIHRRPKLNFLGLLTLLIPPVLSCSKRWKDVSDGPKPWPPVIPAPTLNVFLESEDEKVLPTAGMLSRRIQPFGFSFS